MLRKSVLSLILLAFSFIINAQSLTIDPSNASAILDASSTSKGVLIPRMTSTQRAAISSPSTGLLIYDSTTSSFWYYNGSSWKEITSSAATNWALTGNSGTSSSNNFIGTTDNVSLNFRMNNVASGKIDSTNYLTFLGYGAGKSLTNGNRNTFLGYKAGTSTSQGLSNIAVGSNALYSNTIGSYNISIGDSSLSLQTTGILNTVVGYKAMKKNTIGASNVAIGNNTLENNTNGILNVAIGSNALNSNTTGSSNSAFGGDALPKSTTGLANSAFGNTALYNQTTANFNTALGTGSLFSTTTGSSNTAVGSFSGYSNTTGANNIFLGYSAGYNETGSNKLYISNSNTSSPLIYGDFSTKKLTINDSLQSKYFRMTNGAANGYILQSDASGNGTWVSTASLSASGDNLGNHTATTNINLGSNVISADGTTNGLSLNSVDGGTITGSGGSNIFTIGNSTKISGYLRLLNNTKSYTLNTMGTYFRIHEENVDINPFVIDDPTQSNVLYIKNNKVAVGSNSPTEKLHISEGNLLNTGTFGSSSSLTVSGAGSRMFFYPRKSAFRAGSVSGTLWDDSYIGNYSAALGYNTIASGDYSFAVGNGSSALGSNSFAVGNGAIADATEAIAIGTGTIANNSNAVSIGYGTIANGVNAFSIGYGNIASASNAVALGYANTSSYSNAIAIGSSSIAGASYGVSIGTGNFVTANYGINLGSNLITSSYNEVVVGANNETAVGTSLTSWSTNDRLFVIGNGSSTSARSNAMTVLKNGSVGIGTSSPSEKLEVSGKTKTTTFQLTTGATNGYYLQSDASGNGTWAAAPIGSSVVTAGNGLSYSGSTLNSNWTTSGSNIYSNNTGNVGIGTTSPNSKLDIQSSSQLAINVQSSGSNSYLVGSAPSGFESAFQFKTYSGGSNSNRWAFGKSVTTESGSQTGSDFFINSYNDAGTYLSTPLYITRSTGQVNIGTLSATTETATTLTATTANVTTLNVTGAATINTVSKTASYSLTSSDYCVIFTGITASQTLTLPTSPSAGRVIMIVNHASVAVSTSPSYTTSSSGTSSSIIAGSVVQLLYDGSVWRKIN